VLLSLSFKKDTFIPERDRGILGGEKNYSTLRVEAFTISTWCLFAVKPNHLVTAGNFLMLSHG